MARTHSSTWLQWIFRMAKATQERQGVIRSLIASNIAVEPRNPDNALTLYTDAPSDHPVLKTPHSGRYCMI
jgi:hypothetical protein